jgi:hypothetical protein
MVGGPRGTGHATTVHHLVPSSQAPHLFWEPFYGGVESARVIGLGLELRFTSKAADVLGVPASFWLRFEDGAAVEMACQGLRRVGVTRSA